MSLNKVHLLHSSPNQYCTPLGCLLSEGALEVNRKWAHLKNQGVLDHRWQTQGPWAESGPLPCFIRPGTLFLPGGSAELSLNC